jgi:hypothetical protein
MPVGTLPLSLRDYTVSTTQDLVRGCEIITTHYDDGEVHTVTRGMLHGPWPPTVYRVLTYDGEDECLPCIKEKRVNVETNGLKYWEDHPWYTYKPKQLVIGHNDWVADKESLRPQLIKALRTWHAKLTSYLADAEESLVDAIFNKPL